MHWRRLSSTVSLEASNRTEFQPLARHSEMTARSGQWSRWSATGTDTLPAISAHMPNRTSAPSIFTVLTDVWTISGARSSSAAASTASSVKSLTILMAATPYRSRNARWRISWVGTIGISWPPSGRAFRRPGGLVELGDDQVDPELADGRGLVRIDARCRDDSMDGRDRGDAD